MSARPAAFTSPDSEPRLRDLVSSHIARRDLVLVVEDDDIVAGLVMHILTRLQRRVVRARDGAECLRVFTENTDAIALVILDCRLPDVDGATLYCELRRRLPNVPVLLTSGGRDRSSEVDVSATGATAFLPKPFRPAEVEHKVAELLGAIA